MKNIKHTFIGFVLGLTVCIGIPVFAEALNVVLNPFPVLINGVVTEVEGYNVNGSTFLKLADFKKAGLTVKFNETDRQIEITTAADSSTAAPSTQQNNISGGTKTMIEYDAVTGLPVGAEYTNYKGSEKAVVYNGNTYLSRSDLYTVLGVRYRSTDVKNETTTYGNPNGDVVININDTKSTFFNSSGSSYFNVNLFSGIAGE